MTYGNPVEYGGFGNGKEQRMEIRVTQWHEGYVITWDFGVKRIHHWFGPEEEAN